MHFPFYSIYIASQYKAMLSQAWGNRNQKEPKIIDYPQKNPHIQ